MRQNNVPWQGIERAFTETLRSQGRRKDWAYKRMGITPTTFRGWIQKQKMPLADFVNMCETLGMDPGDFLTMARVLQENNTQQKEA